MLIHNHANYTPPNFNFLIATLRLIQLLGSQKNAELGGIVDENNTPRILVEGFPHSVSVIPYLPVQFHTHTTHPVDKKVSIVDMLSPPSGADYIVMHQAGIIIQYIATESGVWIVSPGPDYHLLTNYSNSINIYFQMLKYMFLNNIMYINPYINQTFIEWYLRYSNVMDPSLILYYTQDKIYREYVEDQLNRVYKKKWSVSDLEKDKFKLLLTRPFNVQFTYYS
jgi:hypothetical protein